MKYAALSEEDNQFVQLVQDKCAGTAVYPVILGGKLWFELYPVEDCILAPINMCWNAVVSQKNVMLIQYHPFDFIGDKGFSAEPVVDMYVNKAGVQQMLDANT